MFSLSGLFRGTLAKGHVNTTPPTVAQTLGMSLARVLPQLSSPSLLGRTTKPSRCNLEHGKRKQHTKHRQHLEHRRRRFGPEHGGAGAISNTDREESRADEKGISDPERTRNTGDLPVVYTRPVACTDLVVIDASVFTGHG